MLKMKYTRMSINLTKWLRYFQIFMEEIWASASKFDIRVRRRSLTLLYVTLHRAEYNMWIVNVTRNFSFDFEKVLVEKINSQRIRNVYFRNCSHKLLCARLMYLKLYRETYA
jgi:hypothetical protein